VGDRPQVTLDHVAQAAGVSLATASRVLNGTKVRSDLRDRVLAAAEQLAYTPNAHAQALARASSQAVGIICHDVSDPYFAGIANGVMRTAAEQDLQVLMASTFRDPEREVSYVAMMRGQRVRAILLIGSGFEDRRWQEAMARELDLYQAGGGRVATVSRHRGLNADSVQPDNKAGAAELAATMARLGHRDFAVLSGPPALTTVVDRVAGFREGLAESGIELADDQVIEGAFTRDGGHAAAIELIERGLKVTCVLAATDIMAVGALTALRDRGLSVPGDVSLTGFDDIPFVRDLTPPLTTYALPLARLGARAMTLALQPPGEPRTERVPGEVVLRASTNPPKSSS